MDLRSIINTEGGDSSITKQATPVTPIQAAPSQQQSFREFSHPPQASPGKRPSHDYGAQTAAPYTSPTSYHAYPSRPPPPPPIQAPPQNDMRSPAGSYTAQSPYRQTPSSSMSGSQYPFPQTHQTPQSPGQHHQYPSPFPPRESYSQPNGPPPHPLQHQTSHTRSSPAPQTPPIGIPGASHQYLQHQRSLSSLSTTTPTSAQSQQPYFHQYPHDSPVPATQQPPSQFPPHQPPLSHPGTPLGPPLAQRNVSTGFTQPTSPFHQRGSYSLNQQTSPGQPRPPSIPRLPSTPGGYDSQRTSTSEPHPRSQSERERSISVSPKTRLPSQPRGDPVPANSQPVNVNGFANPSKRKMEDREAPMEVPKHPEHPEIKSQVNGDHHLPPAAVASSPAQPPKKRIRYTEPPIWARSATGRIKNRDGAPPYRTHSKVNGKQLGTNFSPQSAPSTVVRSETNGFRQVSPSVNRPGPGSQSYAANDNKSAILGPWEESITGTKPFEQLTTMVADWLYLKVVSRGDIGELSSRGVEVEIEAKLGQLINKETNERYYLPVLSECLIADTGRVGFKSSMTETQHRSLNDFLNQRVAETHPANPGQTKKRVKIDYLHRRETDKFYELPPSAHANLPAAVRAELNPRHTIKVRVTHDQKSNQVLAKIVKARIADLDIYNPKSPLDCRISVNFEMRYDGDIEDLIAAGGDNRIPDRSKDRLSYTQSHYQIDLTQVTHVTVMNGVKRIEKEHELEIEVSTAAIREQGLRAEASEPNEYVALVEGLIDNVRVLARAVPPP